MKKLLKKIPKTRAAARKEGSGWSSSVRRDENIKPVKEIILSWGDQPATHKLNIDHGAISCITDQNLNWIRSTNNQDLDLCFLRKCKVEKLTYSNNKKLLPKYTQKILQTAFFSHEKVFNVKQCDACSEENDESRGARGQITLRRETFVWI